MKSSGTAMQAERWGQLQLLAAEVVASSDWAWAKFWDALQPTIDGWLHSPNFLGRVCQDEDYRRDILVLVWEKLQHNDYSKLRAFFNQQSATVSRRGKGHPFGAWTYRVVRNIGIDYMRGLPTFIRNGRKPKAVNGERSPGDASGASTPPVRRWRSLVTLQSDVGMVVDPHTVDITVRQMLEFLDDSISPRQRIAARLYRQGTDMAEIAAQLGVSEITTAQRIVQRSCDRLCYRRALELWSQGGDYGDIARELDLDSPDHAQRIVNAAKELLKRHFR